MAFRRWGGLSRAVATDSGCTAPNLEPQEGTGRLGAEPCFPRSASLTLSSEGNAIPQEERHLEIVLSSPLLRGGSKAKRRRKVAWDSQAPSQGWENPMLIPFTVKYSFRFLFFFN